MEPRITMITLGVSDLDRAVAFYGGGLGLPRRPSSGGVAFFTTQGTWLALYPREKLAEDATVPAEGSGFSGIVLSHNVRAREEVASLLERAARAGARVVKPAADTFWGGHAGYFADPDGHLWEIAWNPHFPIA